MKLQALLFDCDGVLAETERDGHRVAYNSAMKELGIPSEWSEQEYSELVLVSGGKERLNYYFRKYPKKFPSHVFTRELIQEIYSKKTEIFKNMIKEGILPTRSGIARILDEAHKKGVLLFVCSTSHKESVSTLLHYNYGDYYLGLFTELFCGDIVLHKKPAPDIYNLVKEKYNLVPEYCFVVEDSRNGLLAAKGAGMFCIITQSFYTFKENFGEADIVVSCLGDPGGEEAVIIKDSGGNIQKKYITVDDFEFLL
jgi:HAD superfamily hydrolase (TIGR01509 family)